MSKSFTYLNIEFQVTAVGSGRIQVCVKWPRSIYEALRKPIIFTSHNTLAYDYCGAERMSKDRIYKSAKAA